MTPLPDEVDPFGDTSDEHLVRWLVCASLILTVILFLHGCGGGGASPRSCGRAGCGDPAAPGIAQCLADAYLRCTPATGTIDAQTGPVSYTVGGDCAVRVSTRGAVRVCDSLSVGGLIGADACPWLSASACGPEVRVE